MSRYPLFRSAAVLLLLTAFATATGVRAQDKPADTPKEGWSDIAEFSYVATSGNSDVRTLGLKELLRKVWNINSFEIKAGAVRSESTTKTWEVIDAAGDVQEQSTTTLAAENYYLNGRYDRKISDRFFWYTGAGWERNRQAGIDSRYYAVGGVGNIWFNTDTNKWRTDYAATYNKEKDFFEPPGFKDRYTGFRFSWNYLHKWASTTYGNDFIVDENLDTTKDWRGDMTNWVAVAMSEKLALKVSLQWLYRNDPAFTEAADPLDLVAEPVLVQLKKLDSIFTASLVVKF